MKILRPTPQDYDELLTVWEASVRSTHHFLTEENIQFYKPLVRNQYFQAVELYIIRNREGKIATNSLKCSLYIPMNREKDMASS